MVCRALSEMEQAGPCSGKGLQVDVVALAGTAGDAFVPWGKFCVSAQILCKRRPFRETKVWVQRSLNSSSAYESPTYYCC